MATPPEILVNGEAQGNGIPLSNRHNGGAIGTNNPRVQTVDHHANGATDIGRPSRRGRPLRPQSATSVPANKLTTLDVVALMLNKMVGTGIFTTPAAVLVLTGSKSISMVLWFIGGLYSYICLLIYLEFTSAFHYNGGELIYLDRAYRWPPLLATILFSGYFITLANTAGNSIAFAKHVLIAATRQTNFNSDPMLVRYVAISILTVVCFLHMTSSELARFLNKAFAYFKIILLLVVAFRGFAERTEEALQDWQGDSNFSDSMAALVLVFYTFEGWENATYVAGELRALTNDYVRDKKKLRFGAFGAVAIVTLLYMIATAGYFCVLTFDDIKKEESGDLSMAIQFSQKAFGTSFGIAICIALSAVGNLIAVVYTYSRVKQAMAVQNFTPFSKFLKQNKDYPIGGIILHWVVTVVTIVAIPNSADGYSFVLGIFPYGHTIIAIFTGLGFCWINSSVNATERSRYGAGGWIADFSWWNQRYNRCAIALVFILLNLIVIVCAPQQQQGDPDIVPRYLWPVVFFAVEGGAALYWAILMVMSTNYFEKIVKFRAVLYTPGESRGENQGWSRYPGEEEESRLDGSRRRVHIETSNHRYDPLKDAVEGTKSFFYDYIW